MKIWNGIINYGFYFTWRFKCIFQYHFISRSLIGLRMWYMLRKKKNFKKYYKNLNQQIRMDFGMTKFEPILIIFFVGLMFLLLLDVHIPNSCLVGFLFI
jgi:hypothetical protein